MLQLKMIQEGECAYGFVRMFLLLCTNLKIKCHSMLVWCVVVLCEKMVFSGFCASCSFTAVRNASHLVQGVLLEDVGNRIIHHLSWEGCQIVMLWFAVRGHALSCKYPTSAV